MTKEHAQQTNRNKRREDYALQVVPESFRQWSWVSLLSVLFGSSTAMFAFIIGGTFIQTYGTTNFIIGMIVATLFIGCITFIISIVATETGLDMDLITSGAGFGYKGAGFTSLIYALAYVIYFALEGGIISSAIHGIFPAIPIWFLYVVIGAVFIPLTWYGITALNYLMWISLPIYLVILTWSIIVVAHHGAHTAFWGYQPTIAINPKAGPALLQLLAILPAMTTTAAGSADIGRFSPRKSKFMTAFALGFILTILTHLGTELVGAWFSIKLGMSNPGVYFPALLGITGTLFLIMTQIRINVLNTYCGSLAITTFFSRFFNFAPGRHWWVILLALLSTLLMFTNVLDHLHTLLVILSIFIFSWIMAVLSNLLFNHKVFKISSRNFHFQKGSIPDYNPIGLTALGLALITGISLSSGLFGPLAQTLAALTAGTVAFITVPIMTLVVKKNSSWVNIKHSCKV